MTVTPAAGRSLRSETRRRPGSRRRRRRARRRAERRAEERARDGRAGTISRRDLHVELTQQEPVTLRRATPLPAGGRAGYAPSAHPGQTRGSVERLRTSRASRRGTWQAAGGMTRRNADLRAPGRPRAAHVGRAARLRARGEALGARAGGRHLGDSDRDGDSARRGERRAAPASPRGGADSSSSSSFEENLRWVHEAHQFRCELPGALLVTIDFARAHVAARIAPNLSLLLSKKSSSSLSSFLARTLLEAPAAVLLGRRGWQVLHAGAVVGPRGAAVLRGPSGAGKSTLVAAAHRAGLGVLGDESVFVSRRDPDALASSVRDLALREDSARLLGIFEASEPAFTGRERKRRVDLFNGSAPHDRVARRVATVLLGPREPGPARLSQLTRRRVSRGLSRGRDPAGTLARRPRRRRPRVGPPRIAPPRSLGPRRRGAFAERTRHVTLP